MTCAPRGLPCSDFWDGIGGCSFARSPSDSLSPWARRQPPQPPARGVQARLPHRPHEHDRGLEDLPAVRVQLQNAAGQRITTSGVRLGVMLGNDPSGGVLHGATASVTQNGIATFADLSSIKLGSATRSTPSGATPRGSRARPSTWRRPYAAALRFQTNPNNAPAWNTLAAVDVAVVDAYGNAAANPNFPITLSLGANPGTNLIHASGSVGNPVLELVDHQTPALLPPVVNPGPKSVSAMIYEPNVGKIFAADLSNSLSLIDPQSGSQLFLGATGALPTAVKALVFGPVHHALLAGLITEGNLYVVDPMTGVASLLGLSRSPATESSM